MLTNAEYAQAYGIEDEEMTAEMADFAAFTIDLGDARDEHGKRLNPHLQGKGVYLWEVTPIRGETKTVARKTDAQLAAEAHAKRVEEYASRGWAFEQASDDEGDEEITHDDETESDKWTEFFASKTLAGGSWGRRRGVQRDDSATEGLVDSAQ